MFFISKQVCSNRNDDTSKVAKGRFSDQSEWFDEPRATSGKLFDLPFNPLPLELIRQKLLELDFLFIVHMSDIFAMVALSMRFNSFRNVSPNVQYINKLTELLIVTRRLDTVII